MRKRISLCPLFILKLHHVTKTGSGQTWGKLNKRGVFLQHAAKAGACEWTVEYVRGQDDLRYHHGIHPVRKTHTHVPFWLRSHTYMFVECLYKRSHRQTPARPPYRFLSFSYVYPEPVLAKCSFLYINGSKRRI